MQKSKWSESVPPNLKHLDCGIKVGSFRLKNQAWIGLVHLSVFRLGIQIRNMKMAFNFYCTWRWVTFEKLMTKIYDFFNRLMYKNRWEDGRFFTQYYMG